MISNDEAYVDACRIQSYFHARAAERVGPFALMLTPGSAEPGLNYAVPLNDAAPDVGEVAALVAAFRERGMVPRVEYVPLAAPCVERVLVAAGFAEERRPPLMVRRARGATASMPAGIAVQPAEDGDLTAVAAALAEAFGGEIGADWFRATIEAGGAVLLAREVSSGVVVAGGTLTPPAAGVAEVAGIGVRPAFRRRGTAQALTAALAAAAFARGCELVFLSAAGEGEAAIYARAGFAVRPAMLFMALRD